MPELTIVMRLFASTVAVILVIVVRAVARLSSFESVYEFVADSPKSISEPPVIVSWETEVVITKLLPEVLAITLLVPELIAITIADKLAPLANVIVSPLIVSGDVDDITGEATEPVTDKSAIVFVVLSMITVFPVVSGELLVDVDVFDIVSDAL